ncbi:12736_t:CDS:2, partial [Funneliformis mosseae]
TGPIQCPTLGIPYENSARIEKEELNEVKLDDEVLSGPENIPSDSSGLSNQSRLLISILPEDPKEKQKYIIRLMLEQFPSLYLSDSSKRSN